MLYKKQLTKEQVIEKIKQFCVYQERNHNEVKLKLMSYGIKKREVEEVICVMIENNYLNEERFARQFAGGKFRMKNWGRVKIKYELKQKGISDFVIKTAINEIDENDYMTTLTKLTEKKMLTLKNEDHVNIFAKTNAYLLQKGFEPLLVKQAINDQMQQQKGIK